MPDDPRCPRCGRKVGAFATTCLHCRADFEEPVEGNVEESAGSLERQAASLDASADRREKTAGNLERDPALSSGADQSDSGARSDTEDQATSGQLAEGAYLVSRLYDGFLVSAASLQVMITYRRVRIPAVPDGREHLRRAGAVLDATETRRDGLRVAIGFVTTAGLALLAVPRPELGLLAGLGLTGYLFTRETVVDVVSAASYGVGLSLVALGLGTGIGILTGAGLETSILAWARGVVPMVVGTALVLTGGWLNAITVAEATDEGPTEGA